ncbi:MAG TPA: TonB-dependent receptor [Flavipsychrobacter sp.]|nr:TonB-dependent receptor [Flavipsychrobacter sp.]
MFQKLLATTTLLFSFLFSYAQQATISGLVKDEQGKPIDQATVAVAGTDIGTHTNEKGYYLLQVPAQKNITIVFTYVGFETLKKPVSFKSDETRTWDVVLKVQATTIQEFVKKDDRGRYEAGSITIDPNMANINPSPIGGVEGIIKTIVGSNNELTSQYSVRGGNYDENLVYVNDFEIYRPFLVQSGQQEGLSFINPDLVSSVNFSVGGFQAKYGDKMASVLDVGYKHPTHFAGSVMLSLLGASLHLEGASKNQKLTYLFGARQKSDQYLLQSQPTKGVYIPSFTDVQGLINYRFNEHWEIEAIGNYARNRFIFYPQNATVNFGLINKAFQLHSVDSGGEIDQFDTRFAGVSASYRPNEKLKLKLLASGFQTNERQTFDISQEYLFGELQTDQTKQNFGQIQYSLGTGLIHDYTRDFLTADVGNVGFRGSYDAHNNFILWGADATITHIDFTMHEWEQRDSSNFSQPYDPYGPTMSYLYNANDVFNYTRIDGFVQDNFRFNDSLHLTGSAGVRFNYSFLNNELVTSPRVQFGYKPDWKNDVVFRFATGVYAQPPFFREMIDLQGDINKSLRAQKSYHVVLGIDDNFKMYDRPFKFTAEVYYKYLWDMDPYTYDNIQVRYYAKNDAIGYVYGGEARLYGDLVKGATSWISIGLLKAAYNIADQKIIYRSQTGADSASVSPGYIPMPNDQRFMLGMYFEDYLPRNKNFKVHLNAIYTSGLPFGPPNQPAYADTLRLPAYKRVDIGFSALLLDGSRKHRPAHSFFNNIHSIWASLEVFNLLDIENTLSYTWIEDQTSGKTYAVPNRLTSRLFNLKIITNF